MFAIIRSGGKQYKVQPGDVIRVEKLEQALGTEFDVTEVLMVGGDTATVGKPLVDNAKVTVVVTKQTRDRKVIIFKKKRRQGYRRFKTHRQPFTELFVKAIAHAGKSAKADGAAKVLDVDQSRLDRIAQRTEDRIARNTPGAKEDAAPAKKATVKKAAPKKAVKKTGAAKKKAGAKKAAGKKTAKKTK
jgi:large subunit ribosomal protein L21